MSHEIESMLYVGMTPWHKLGVRCESAPDVPEALRISNLANWNVQPEYMFLADGTKTERRALVRKLDGTIVGYCGERADHMQNEETYAVLTPFIEGGHCTIETMGSLFNGKKTWGLARINRDPMEILPGDNVQKYLLVANSFDGTLSLRIGLTPVRVVCNNTLTTATGVGNKLLRIKNTKNASANLQNAAEQIAAADATFERTGEIFRAMARKQLSAAGTTEFFRQVFPKAASGAVAKRGRPAIHKVPTPVDSAGDLAALLSMVETGGASVGTSLDDIAAHTVADSQARCISLLEQLVETGHGANVHGVRGTVWGAYNAVTEYVTHERGRSAENRSAALLGGIGSEIIDNAMAIASRML